MHFTLDSAAQRCDAADGRLAPASAGNGVESLAGACAFAHRRPQLIAVFGRRCQRTWRDGVTAGQRLIACANLSTGRAGQRRNALRRFPRVAPRRVPQSSPSTVYSSRRISWTDERRGPPRPATNRLATARGAAEQCVPADEAGASAEASPLNAVLCGQIGDERLNQAEARREQGWEVE